MPFVEQTAELDCLHWSDFVPNLTHSLLDLCQSLVRRPSLASVPRAAVAKDLAEVFFNYDEVRNAAVKLWKQVRSHELEAADLLT